MIAPALTLRAPISGHWFSHIKDRGQSFALTKFQKKKRSEHLFRDIRFRISKTRSKFYIGIVRHYDIEAIGDIEQLQECQNFRRYRGLHGTLH